MRRNLLSGVASVWVLLGLLCAVLPVPGARAANLLQNPGFDADLAGWALNAPTQESWDPMDEMGSNSSGSVLETLLDAQADTTISIEQCVAVMGSQTYRAAASIFASSAQAASGGAQALLFFFDDASCTVPSFVGSNIIGFYDINSMGVWQAFQQSFAAPGTALSASIVLQCFKTSAAGSGTFSCHHDNVFLPGPPRVLLGSCALGMLGLLAWRQRSKSQGEPAA